MDMIQEASMVLGYVYDGGNLKTFNEWAKDGYIVTKGEKAFLSLKLWKPVEKKVVDEDGKPVMDEKTGKQKTETQFILKMCHLFTPEQVEKGELKKRPAKKKRTYKKKAS